MCPVMDPRNDFRNWHEKQQSVALSALKNFSEMQNTKAIKDFWQGVEELNRRNEINKKKTKYLIINFRLFSYI
ncbi:uncharacterized protein OCT59_011228 [Rhizophagus irregularis]|uniref:uncharacterized protein n=1 Tax=Rhizophagus irregularis TaxID=588596 RepID=UPI0019F54950|nr:hypothetical protein OCT59_011228 [Rhizophagus irregularis]GBC23640.2 hypothetical protein GLOIN_2v1739297 [Rhizophagus irregularis DAOM 181602=DAOM 197198]